MHWDARGGGGKWKERYKRRAVVIVGRRNDKKKKKLHTLEAQGNIEKFKNRESVERNHETRDFTTPCFL